MRGDRGTTGEEELLFALILGEPSVLEEDLTRADLRGNGRVVDITVGEEN